MTMTKNVLYCFAILLLKLYKLDNLWLFSIRRGFNKNWSRQQVWKEQPNVSTMCPGISQLWKAIRFMIYYLFTILLKLVASSFRKIVADFSELSSRGILSVISAYWNPWYTPCIVKYTLLIWFEKPSDEENTFSNGVLSSFLWTVMLETKRQGLQGYGWVIYVRGTSIKTILK